MTIAANEPDPAELGPAAGMLRGAERILFITGAGLSADSGMPTYRGIGGLHGEGTTEEGVTIEEALSGAMLARDPALCWRHLARIADARRGRVPNAGHRAIAAFERAIPGTLVLTQNVDGFHRAAGSRRVIDIHGDLAKLRCTRCAWRRTLDPDAPAPESLPPRCPECDAVARPEVVLFGETLPAEAVDRLTAELDRGFDVVLSVGTSSLFPYVVEPVLRARRAGRGTIEINPERTVISDVVDVQIARRAAETLERLRAAVLGGGR